MKISRARLIVLRGSKCEVCNLTSWLGEAISFIDHHKDRNRKNNAPENRIILCPNCHSQEHKTRSKEFKRKCSESAKGNSYCKGRTLSEEHKQRLRDANVGRRVSAEVRMKMSLSRKGKNHSAETKRKMSESMSRYWASCS